MIKPRSYGACWTCRIRKLSCDETSGTCQRCHSLRITCHGYGTKPIWMDGGQEERNEVEKIKRQVKETNRLKRLSCNTKTGHTAIQQGLQSPPHIAEPASPLLALMQDNITLVASDLWSTTESIKSADNNESENTSCIAHSMPGHSPPSIFCDTLGEDLAGVSRNSHGAHTLPLNSEEPLSPSRELCLPSSLTEDEACLLMHYLDYVFYLQFPFYNPPAFEGGRGWLFTFILITPALWSASLSLSSYHMHCTMLSDKVCQANLNAVENFDNYHTMSLTRLRRHLEIIETTSNTSNIGSQIGILASMIQLVSFEAARGSINWLTHLQGASAIVQNIQTSFIQSRKFLSEDSLMSISSSSGKKEVARKPQLSRHAQTALDFFITAFIWFDILSCTTTGSKPSCPDWLLSFIHDKTGRLRFCKVMGCQNWVIVIIMEIGALDYWKRECQFSGSLSMRELANRATCIEKRLNRGLATNANRDSSNEPASCRSPRWESRTVTEAFACSALTYLHVVLSGPYPELPEIKGSVQRTFRALQDLKEKNWIDRLVWPFCIAGCMALPHIQDDFRKLAFDANQRCQGLGSLGVVVAIVEECWAVRYGGVERGSGVCDWRTAMKNLGLSVLLI